LKSHVVDLVILLALLLAIYRGYKAGLLKTFFSFIGFVGGGLIGLIYSVKLVQLWHGNFQKFGLIFLAIFVAASLGEALLGRFAKFFHNRVLFGPFKWADSWLGAALSFARTSIFIYIMAHLLLAMPWSWAHSSIPQSTIYKKMNSLEPGIVKKATASISNLHSSQISNLLG